jgi:hypothetical protein
VPEVLDDDDVVVFEPLDDVEEEELTLVLPPTPAPPEFSVSDPDAHAANVAGAVMARATKIMPVCFTIGPRLCEVRMVYKRHSWACRRSP